MSTAIARFVDHKDRIHPNAEAHREGQKSKSMDPHMKNTTSTTKYDVPSVGADKAPPELISSVDGESVPKDDNAEKSERQTGATQPGDPDNVSEADLGVGEMEGVKVKVAPLRRTGEDATTMRARLLCPCFVYAWLFMLLISKHTS